MQLRGGLKLFSATDLVGFLECEHLAELDLLALGDAAARALKSEPDEAAALIARKGDEHERRYLAWLRDLGRNVADPSSDIKDLDERAARTMASMRAGAEVVYQATLRDGALVGHADFLRRVEGTSAFGNWHYEVIDTKLARSPKAKFLVQLAFYSHLLSKAQGAEPRMMHVVLGDWTERSYRCADYLHYLRELLARFVERVDLLTAQRVPATYPAPCDYCELCHWRERCAQRRIADDHLCQVARITRVQWTKLQSAGVDTLAKLAKLPPTATISAMHADTLERLRSQAALQERQRRTGRRDLLTLPLDPEQRRGFYRLPEPSKGDLFFDMEGDPLENSGLEYLFGVGWQEGDEPHFRAFWGHDRAGERHAFEQFMDFVTAHRVRHPGAHIYHYASYEESALKRLASLHATREVEVDNLLRYGALVDLYKVVRESIRISEPSYSLKSVEHFYRGEREGDVRSATASIVWYERWRDTGDAQLLQDIEAYNRDDVESTRQLRDWLLTLRPAHLPWKERAGSAASAGGEDNRSQRVRDAEERLAYYRELLVEPLPPDRSAWASDHHAAELTHQLLGFHRRADKPQWWALFARMDMTEDELLEDAECLAGLTLDPANPPRREGNSTIYTYVAPEQETKLAAGDACTRCDTAGPIGTLEFDETARRVRLKLGAWREPLPQRLSIGAGGPIDSSKLTEALYRYADSIIEGNDRYAALEQLLRRQPPRLTGHAAGAPIIAPGEDLLGVSVKALLAMDRTCLYIQGPPGAGKTYTGSHMIFSALREGWRVGITSNSHKAINHLLAEVTRVASKQGTSIAGVKKATRGRPETEYVGPEVINEFHNDDVWAVPHQFVAGTAWLFADPAADQQLDVLFVDEAGQVSLANLVAAGTCARNIVLLGDQMQLAQPIQGVHPGRSGDSALDYLLDGAATVAPDRGIFLSTSWRMHPDVCRFISDAVYDSRLEPQPHNVMRTLVLDGSAHPLLRPAGIVHAAVKHTDCSQRSQEEAALVAEIYASALKQRYTDRDGNSRPMTAANILVVAPYNMQVNLLKRTLPPDARVGTVDKFQGQEAELVIVSMTTSSEQDLPRHVEFLYSRNRLNVAISRAKCLAIVIANPALLAIKCRTPEQMALVNTLCWVVEVGRTGTRTREHIASTART